jgi:excinuclease ABC subunit A
MPWYHPQGMPPRASASRSASAREPDFIEIDGAREHNLAIDHLAIPKRQLVVFTGPSGSGKSSLAFDTLYAEGQRRYIETLSAYARQFLGQLERPKVDRLRGLSPTIAIEQKAASGNPRSTVGTITEVMDYLRVVFAKAGVQHCFTCGKKVAARGSQALAREIADSVTGTRLTVLAPLARQRKGEFRDVFAGLQARGFTRVRLDGAIVPLDPPPAVDKKKRHDLDLVIDRLTLKAEDRRRLSEAAELALAEGKGEMITVGDDGVDHLYSQARACCGHAYPELVPASFSFNSPVGMCPVCTGLGKHDEVDPALVIPDPNLSIRGGAIAPWANAMAKGDGWTTRIVTGMGKAFGVDLDTPWKALGKAKQKLVLYGNDGQKIAVTFGKAGELNSGTWAMRYSGVIPNLERKFRETSSEAARALYRKFLREMPCDSCRGERLKAESRAVRLMGKTLPELCATPLGTLAGWMNSDLPITPSERPVLEGPVNEVRARLRFLLDVGLDYLSLDRSGPTLSGGEAQRIRLASQLGSELSGVIYVLDEPSIGLHARDNQHLVGTLERLRDLGNTVVVVEHDEETIRAADHVVDFGPGAGHQGGKVTFAGTPTELAASDSLTGQFISGRRRIAMPKTRRPPTAHITVEGARAHNLHGIDVKIPLGVFTAVTGVSGAGKSSLVNGILLPALGRALHDSEAPIGEHRAIRGLEALERVIAIDQQPIGRTPRSNPATYTKVFDLMRDLFAQLPEARARGYGPGRFSFNVAEAITLFSAFPKLSRILKTLQEVGLGYMKLGQPATTLSGGEAQRIKLSRELGKSQSARTLYVLDEPTTGLHFEDIDKLLGVLQRLVDAGSSVLVIEHNLDVVKCADWVIDLGPEGGARGGRLIAEGTPEQVARVPGSFTGQFLAPLLAREAPRRPRNPKELAAANASR